MLMPPPPAIYQMLAGPPGLSEGEKWHAGHCIFVGLLFLADCPAKLLWHLKLATDLLQALGFAINAEKSEIDPSLIIELLGFILDSIRMSIKIT